VQRRSLISMGRRSGDPDTMLRFRAVARLGLGHKSPRVAADLDVARSTVVKAARRFDAEGAEGLLDRRRFNGRAKVDERFRRRVMRLLRRTPQSFGWCRPTWTRELLCAEMTRQDFAQVAVCTMGRVLSDVGARLGVARPFVACPWPRARKEAVVDMLRAIAACSSDQEPVFYADEVDIHLNPRIGRDWMLRGHQRRILTPGKNAKHYIAGALAAHDRRLTYVDGPSKCSALFIQLLFRLLARYRRASRIHLIVDNFIIHDSHATRRALASFRGRVVLHFLPPYCPEHNRIEREWQNLHANVTRNHRCKTMAALLANARRYLDQRRPKPLRRHVRELRSVI
jgi:transposase